MTSGPAPMPITGTCNAPVYRRADFIGHALEQHDVGAGLLQALRLLHDARGGILLPSLHAETTGLVHGLRPQAQMRAHRDVMRGEEFHDAQLLGTAFQFHHARAAFLHQRTEFISACSGEE